MRFAQLGDLADLITKGTTPTTLGLEFSDSGYPFLRVQNIKDGRVDLGTDALFISSQTHRALARSVVRPHDLLISIAGTIGRVAEVPESAPEMNCNQAVAIIRLNDKAFRRYVYHALGADSTRNQLRLSEVTGTITNLSLGELAKVKIPLPPLPEQRRIAAILDHADALRSKRRAAIAKLDSLAQSIFLDMFGDPVSNPKHWERLPFGDLLTGIDSGSSPVCLDRSRHGEEWGILKLSAVTRCEFDATQNKAVRPGFSPDLRMEIIQGDLLFTRKNTYALVAACALVRDTEPRLLLPDLIFRLRLREDAELVPQYLHQLLIHPGKRRDIQSLAGGSAGSMPNISKSSLVTVLIERPPLSAQQVFANRIEGVEKVRGRLRESLRAFDAVFSSLQQRAFIEGL